MDFSEFDTHGRVVVHHFYSELEKIAISAGVVARASAKAAERLAETKKLLGAKRFMPGSGERKAWLAAKAKNSRMQGLADGNLLAKRKAALTQMQSGSSAGQAAGRTSLDSLNNMNAPTSSINAARRRVGMGGGEIKPPSEGILASPMARKAALGVGAAATGAAGLYAGQQYLSQPSGPQYR